MSTALPDVSTSNRVFVTLTPAIRHAIHHVCDSGMVGSPEVRDMVVAGLKSLGWDEARVRREYALYEAKCIERGEVNVFTGERL